VAAGRLLAGFLHTSSSAVIWLRSQAASASPTPNREAIPSKGIVGHRPFCETARHERRAGAATAGAAQPVRGTAAAVAPPPWRESTRPGRAGGLDRTAHLLLKTGRSRPSRQVVLRLADTLDVGLRETNELLHAAGLPGTYRQATLKGPDLAPYRAAIDRMLNSHEPYPAMVIDRHWNVILANRACSRAVRRRCRRQISRSRRCGRIR
jgi:hypothetical protein